MLNNSAAAKLYEDLQTQVHVWFCRPAEIQDESKLSAYKSVLSKPEQDQFHRFHYKNDSHSYLVSHALLRHALSKYAALPASQWQFSKNEFGKPELSSASNISDICFNLTHTEDLSACVISLNRRCGIDAEKTERKNSLRAIAQRMFADTELQRLDEENIDRYFYYYWTLREAYVKALGTGLSGSSKEYFFAIKKDDLSVELQNSDRLDFEVNKWQFRLYEPTQEHVLAVGFESDEKTQVIMNEFIP